MGSAATDDDAPGAAAVGGEGERPHGDRPLIIPTMPPLPFTSDGAVGDEVILTPEVVKVPEADLVTPALIG